MYFPAKELYNAFFPEQSSPVDNKICQCRTAALFACLFLLMTIRHSLNYKYIAKHNFLLLNSDIEIEQFFMLWRNEQFGGEMWFANF